MEFLTPEAAAVRVKELERVAEYRPSSALFADLSTCYYTLGEPEKALPYAVAAFTKNRKAETAQCAALILRNLGRHEESFRYIEEAYWLKPEDDYIRLGYGEALLRAGFWEQGWPIFDNARPTQQLAAMDLHLPYSVKEWQGQLLEKGQRLFVINEGGTGDRILYARWLWELDKMGIEWIFHPYEELFSMYERIIPRHKLSRDGDTIEPNPTHWTTTFSLPAKLKASPGRIPAPTPITPDPLLVEKYKIQRTDSLPVLGICYEAAEKFQGGLKIRSLSEGQAMRLVTMTGHKVHWVSLQYGKKMPFPVTNVEFKTWEDTAALIANLDGVVTVDTGVMHLAGSLGVPVKTILSGHSCWKFLARTKRCPLYPTSRLYRNPGYGFETAINEVVADLLK